MDPFTWYCLGCVVVAVVAARRLRGHVFAVFTGVLTAVQALVSAALAEHLPVPLAVLVALQALVVVHFVRLARPRMRGLPWRLLVSYPAMWWLGGAIFALPWAVAAGLGFDPAWPWLPWAVALLGLAQSLGARAETRDLVIDRAAVSSLVRHPHGEARTPRPLRIAQITDPHLGPFMSERRLRRVCERVVEHDPDLVLLTGDFLTMESRGEPPRDGRTLLGRALSPLKALEGRSFACMGNHDHEAPGHVARGLAEAGVRLLVDAEATLETPAGPVQIVGVDYHFRDRARRLAEVVAAHPRRPGHLRLVLLHDPGAFRHLPEGEGDLVLSGHTHGGQVGFVSLGLPWTLVSVFARMPDHGFWARGRDRLYVHRGTGHYGFPLRVGVPAERGLIRVHLAVPE